MSELLPGPAVDARQQPPRATAICYRLLAGPEGLAATPDNKLVVVESETGNVTLIDLSTGGKTSLAEGLSSGFTLYPVAAPAWGLNGVAVGASGTIYVGSPLEGHLYSIPAP